ncbi:mitochondrial genome maintenance protein MGM101 [Exophiala spinifera]|uniref:Mitochondrial genome maintenance protein MGM101 n=1 Tax=Exophiala spinifera TaxID=91928 RepID=A0A0D2BLX4_9EURO|nr:mitochondrial genome maintenance protein MGM101 [Exophiala spinifera]KIW19570.1 mitochondrial genome maintenance protein MGM101 [Exophiala spinifera]
MLPLPRLPLQAKGVRTTTLRSLGPDLSSSASYLFVRRSKQFGLPSRAILISSFSRRAQSTATQPPKIIASPDAPPNEPSSDRSDAQPLKTQEEDPAHVDWSKSFHGLSAEPFSKEAADVLMAPLSPDDVEIKPDGIIYLPEIKYRRILNRAFGPGGWGLAPRGDTIVTDKAVTREYALLAHGRLVSIARGEQDYFNKDGIPTASEGCKSNAMMRCCKDLGVASELWDPRFIRKWKAEYARDVFVEHQGTKKRTKIWLRKGDPVSYPYAEIKR